METTHFSEGIVMEILARLPLRSTARFKSVRKAWKSTLESAYFRRLFVSLHNNSSSSWSLLSLSGSEEYIGFHGCETWDLQKSLASCIPPSFQRIPPFHFYKFNHEAFSNGLVLIEEQSNKACYVGNPVLQQWVEIPPPPDSSRLFGFVTRVDEDGVVLSFKVVRLYQVRLSNDYVSHSLSVSLYSSDTGMWTSKLRHCPCQITNISFMTLNGTIYFYYLSQAGAFAAHDFYSESDQFRVVYYSDHSSDNNPEFIRSLTTSRGFVMYIRTLAQEEETVFKVWKLNNDDSWQLLWNLGLPSIGTNVPMAMHPFDSCIVYLWSLQNRHLVTCNLRARNYIILGENDEHQDCVIDQPSCEKYMDDIWGSKTSHWDYGVSIRVFIQFVFPRWMESVPRPPQVEMIDTTALLSYITSMQKEE
ncbi:hypothetical protein AALP_AA2G208900 [Arabis alpina]|uniref:F-box protein At3g26010-like beta-propeller domain-containing protein n=1 Tax=Arabis alpina TaxID=50452 RepID=A0A087HIY1_ARAAL|nr:hypothetical protein AALP_AA2G208900 [Arabis alpina]